jgi:hypothetical protein
MLPGKNCLVLDLETAHSADDCQYCGQEASDHLSLSGGGHCGHLLTTVPGSTFARIGWDNTRALGLSVGCYFDYQDMAVHWFDGPTLEATVASFVERQPLLVSFNGIQLDFRLMRALLREGEDPLRMALCDTFKVLCAASYDILAEIWKADPARKFERGLNSLGAISEANGYGAKAMDGVQAPRLWRAGRYAEVLNYCAGDVDKTRRLFEQILTTGTLLRGDGEPITLPLPPQMPEGGHAHE